jgi:hypothetical protein
MVGRLAPLFPSYPLSSLLLFYFLPATGNRAPLEEHPKIPRPPYFPLCSSGIAWDRLFDRPQLCLRFADVELFVRNHTAFKAFDYLNISMFSLPGLEIEDENRILPFIFRIFFYHLQRTLAFDELPFVVKNGE